MNLAIAFSRNKNKLIILLLLLAGSIQTKAQDYIPLAVENAQWLILQDDVETPYPDQYYGYKIHGDTVINAIAYKKVYSRSFISQNGDYSEPYILIDNGFLFAVVRDDTINRKVYAITFYDPAFCPINEEFLLFDFTLAVGDYFDGLCIVVEGGFFEVEQVYQTFIFGQNRTIQTGYDGCIEIIEGVGSIYGLFEGVGCVVKKGLTHQYLISYCVGTDQECLDGFIVSVKELQKNRDVFTIHPNPANNILNIETELQNALIIITDITGKQIYTSQIFNFKTQIDFSNQPEGIYIIKISNKELMLTKKIIVSH